MFSGPNCISPFKAQETELGDLSSKLLLHYSPKVIKQAALKSATDVASDLLVCHCVRGGMSSDCCFQTKSP